MTVAEQHVQHHRRNVARSAAIVVPAIMDLVRPRSVLDVGCCTGEWVEEFAQHGCDVIGVDIDPPDGIRYLQHDLTEPLDLGITVDLVVSLEVGEHLPEHAADTYVDTIARHADTVFFSAAVIGQDYDDHVNCQNPEYWQAKFADRGYTCEKVEITDRQVLPWYRNSYLYRR